MPVYEHAHIHTHTHTHMHTHAHTHTHTHTQSFFCASHCGAGTYMSYYFWGNGLAVYMLIASLRDPGSQAKAQRVRCVTRHKNVTLAYM
jgi:hypothetical protein